MSTARDARAGVADGRNSRRQRPTAAVVGVALVALVAGLALGRFLTADAEPVATAAPPAARTPQDQVAALEQTVAADPDDLGALQALGTAYVQRAIEVGDPAFYRLAEDAFDRADAVAPSDPGTLLGRGVLALSLHQFTEAERLGRQVVEARPASAASYAVLVDAQVELGRYDQAAETLQTMLDLRPGLAALARTSYLRELFGDLPGAIVAMRQAEQAGSGAAFDVAAVTALLGDLHLKAGNLEAASDAYERALRQVPGLVAAEVGRARVLAAQGRGDEAIALLTGVTDRFPQPQAVILLAHLQERQGLTAEAADTAELVRTLATLQESAGQVVDLEMALFEADRGENPQRAVELARAAHAARPDNVYAADALAWALHRAGDSQAALPHVQTALRLGTADAALRYHAAAVLAAVGDDAGARTQLEAAFELSPWATRRYRDDATALAERLGVAVPAAWSAS